MQKKKLLACSSNACVHGFETAGACAPARPFPCKVCWHRVSKLCTSKKKKGTKLFSLITFRLPQGVEDDGLNERQSRGGVVTSVVR